MATDIKVPKGYKRCPKCKGLVKGPRTKTCTNPKCKHTFVAKVAAVVTQPKPATVVTPPVNPIVPDPYTFATPVQFDQEPLAHTFWIRYASGVYRYKQEKVRKFLANITEPESVQVDNFVVTI